MNQTAVFDLWDLFANELVGSAMLFVILGAIVIALVCIKNKIPFSVMVCVIALFFSAVYAVNSGFEWIWILMLFFSSGFLALMIARLMSRS